MSLRIRLDRGDSNPVWLGGTENGGAKVSSYDSAGNPLVDGSVGGVMTSQVLLAELDGVVPSGTTQIWTDPTGVKYIEVTPAATLTSGVIIAVAWSPTVNDSANTNADAQTAIDDYTTPAAALLSNVLILTVNRPIVTLYSEDATIKTVSAVSSHNAELSLILDMIA